MGYLIAIVVAETIVICGLAVLIIRSVSNMWK